MLTRCDVWMEAIKAGTNLRQFCTSGVNESLSIGKIVAFADKILEEWDERFEMKIDEDEDGKEKS